MALFNSGRSSQKSKLLSPFSALTKLLTHTVGTSTADITPFLWVAIFSGALIEETMLLFRLMVLNLFQFDFLFSGYTSETFNSCLGTLSKLPSK